MKTSVSFKPLRFVVPEKSVMEIFCNTGRKTMQDDGWSQSDPYMSLSQHVAVTLKSTHGMGKRIE